MDDFVKRRLDNIDDRAMHALILSLVITLNTNVENLTYSIIVTKSYPNILSYNKFLDHNRYSNYLGHYLAYLYQNNLPVDDLLKKVGRNPRLNLTPFTLSYLRNLYNDERDSDMLYFFIDSMKRIFKESVIINAILIIFAFSMSMRILNKLKEVYLLINFRMKPLDVLKYVINDSPTFDEGFLKFLLNVYGDEAKFEDIVKYIRDEGRNEAKLWLDEVILNQI